MSNAVENIIRVSQPSLCLDASEILEVHKLAEVIEAFTSVQGEEFVKKRSDAPLAEILMQDVTPLRTCTMHVSGADKLHVVRRGRKCREWLLQRLFLCDSLGNRHVVLSDPRDMGSKSASAHYQAGVQLWPGSRLLGHQGLLISHGCWDRAIEGACSKLQIQRTEALKEHEGNSSGDSDQANWRYLWCWNTHCGCSAHDFSNSLRWAFMWAFGDKELMRRTWIVIESLRSSLDQLMSCLAGWLSSVLQFDNNNSTVDLRMVWILLGLTPAWAAEFAELQLRFHDGHVIVSVRFQHDPKLLERLASCFQYLFDFRGWSDTRWCAVGRSCRRLLACEMLGLRDLVRFLRESP